jgi:hypothetical protein
MALALAGLLLLSACAEPTDSTGQRGSPGEARGMVVAYLEAAAGGAADRGWSLILPSSRSAYDSEDQYVQLAESAAWDEFSWRLAEPAASHCEDGGLYCQIRLHVTGEPPAFLLEAPNSAPDDVRRTLQLDPESAVAGNAWIVVYFEPNGNQGISTGGG